ncbi:unnamed protein product [Diamesa hyperborea]
MSGYYYLDFTLTLKEDPEELLPVFVKGAIIKSMHTVFGEIGGQTTIDLLRFDESRKRGILRVNTQFQTKLRAALTLIPEFQGIPAIFHVNQASPILLSLTDSFLEF